LLENPPVIESIAEETLSCGTRRSSPKPGRRRGLPGGFFSRRPMGGMERQIPGRCPPLLEGRKSRRPPSGHPHYRLQRPLSADGRKPFHSINFVTAPRRLHPQRPVQLLAQA
jgi:hypothetical protein